METDLYVRCKILENEKAQLEHKVEDIRKIISEFEGRINAGDVDNCDVSEVLIFILKRVKGIVSTM